MLAMMTVMATSLSTAVLSSPAHSVVAVAPPPDYPNPFDWFRPVPPDGSPLPTDNCSVYGICP